MSHRLIIVQLPSVLLIAKFCSTVSIRLATKPMLYWALSGLHNAYTVIIVNHITWVIFACCILILELCTFIFAYLQNIQEKAFRKKSQNTLIGHIVLIIIICYHIWNIRKIIIHIYKSNEMMSQPINLCAGDKNISTWIRFDWKLLLLLCTVERNVNLVSTTYVFVSSLVVSRHVGARVYIKQVKSNQMLKNVCYCYCFGFLFLDDASEHFVRNRLKPQQNISSCSSSSSHLPPLHDTKFDMQQEKHKNKNQNKNKNWRTNKKELFYLQLNIKLRRMKKKFRFYRNEEQNDESTGKKSN